MGTESETGRRVVEDHRIFPTAGAYAVILSPSPFPSSRALTLFVIPSEARDLLLLLRVAASRSGQAPRRIFRHHKAVRRIALQNDRALLLSVVADGFYGAGVHGFLALRLFFLARRLAEDEGEGLLLVALKVVGGGDPANVAIDALRVHVVLAGDILGKPVSRVGHREKVSRERS
jgi:hypothetical protein